MVGGCVVGSMGGHIYIAKPKAEDVKVEGKAQCEGESFSQNFTFHCGPRPGLQPYP